MTAEKSGSQEWAETRCGGTGCLLNQSQGGMCICRVLGIWHRVSHEGLGLPYMCGVNGGRFDRRQPQWYVLPPPLTLPYRPPGRPHGGGQVRSSLAGLPLLSTQQGDPRPEGRAGTTHQDGSASPGQCLRRRTRHRGDTADRCWEQPGTPPLRSCLRIPVRGEPDTCFLRQDRPTSLEPRWRPPGQCGSLSHRCGPAS